MICIFVFFGVSLVCLLLIILFYRQLEEAVIVPVIFFVIFTALGIRSIVYPTQRYIDEKIEEYYHLKEQIDVINLSNNKDIKRLFIPELQKKVDNMNKIILDNKYNYNSKWNGCMYSKNVADLELLKINY